MEKSDPTARTGLYSDIEMPDQRVVQLHKSVGSTLAFPARDGYRLVVVERIIRLEADGGYTYVYEDDGRKHLVCRRIGELHTQLPQAKFFRCHHGHVVNLSMVVELLRNGGTRLVLCTGDKIMVARRRWNDLLAALGHPK